MADWPTPLISGSMVALVSPSGPVRTEGDLVNAERNALEMGWKSVRAANAKNKHGYFAGPDQERVLDLNTAICDDTIDALWCVRGGYGAMRLLRDVDYTSLARTPKPIIGYSDITALHAAIARNCEIVSFHGPTARGKLTEFSRESLRRAVVDQTDSCGEWTPARTVNSGVAAGRLSGGNLALVASLTGTGFELDLTDAILVIEDINEAVYRVDRMLHQLVLSGSLDNCAAIAAGDFTLPPDDTDSAERSVDDVLFEIATQLGIPCLSGIPVGHIEDQWTIPMGARATLDADAKTLNVLTPANTKNNDL